MVRIIFMLCFFIAGLQLMMVMMMMMMIAVDDDDA
jgi:hypothetical protein